MNEEDKPYPKVRYIPGIPGPTGPKGERGPRGMMGPQGMAGPIGKKGNDSIFTGIHFQIQKQAKKQVENNELLHFDTQLNDHAKDIFYDNDQHVFRLSEQGNYFIEWSFSIDGALRVPYILFTLLINDERSIISSLPITTGTLSGSAFITVNHPTTLKFLNTSGEIVQLTDAPVQGNLVILRT